MRMDRIAFVLAPILALTLTSPARANISGGTNAATDCYAEWGGLDGTGTSFACTDGDSSCDADGTANGSCSIAVSICTLQTDVTGCTPTGPLTKLKRVGAPFKTRKVAAPDLSASGCGSPATFVLKLRGKQKDKPSKAVKLKMVAVGSGGKDTNTLKLTCVKSGGTTGGGGATCPANPSGPSKLTLTSTVLGTDLDNGWTGTSHDFPVVVGSSITMCLSNCNTTDDPICDGTGTTGADSANGLTFGAPLPLFAAGTPVCVINRFNLPSGPITGSANMQTGEITGQVKLLSDVYQADDPGNVCVRCQTSGGIGSTGTCAAGPDQGKACTVDGTDFVSDSTGDKNYKLSKSCRPSGSLVGTLDITLPLTTGTSTSTPGSKPCTAKPGEPTGVPVKDDKCQENGGTCTGTCSCASTDSKGNCIDAKGGVRQTCCSNDATRSCFPTAPGTAGVISRTGAPAVPQPALPDATFPKTADIVQAAVFCEAGTSSNVINGLTGLPGPGALLLPTNAKFEK